MVPDYFDLKLAFSIAAFVVVVVAYIPYVRDMFAGRTKPHAYTWLIWTVTLAIAAAGLWYGGGGYAAINLTAVTVFTGGIFLLSFRYGTKNVTQGDAVLLALALVAVIPWTILKDPTFSVIMVTVIDVAGYWPSIRKSYKEPWSEYLPTWYLFTLSALFLIFALDRYNLLTMIYIGATIAANLALIGTCIVRRRVIAKPALIKP
ncbi:MAG: hypothetical protein AAB923_02870 [Patescibacteria group bacterium]